MIKLRNNIPSDTFTLHEGEYVMFYHRQDGRFHYGGWLCSYPYRVQITSSLVILYGKPQLLAGLDGIYGVANRSVIKFQGNSWITDITLIPLGSKVQYVSSMIELNELIDRGILHLQCCGAFTKEGFRFSIGG